MAKTKIVWSPAAIACLNDITTYISKDAPMRAIEFAQRLFYSADQLEDYPISGSLCPEDTSCRQLTVDACRLIYELSEGRTDILTIISPSQDVIVLATTAKGKP